MVGHVFLILGGILMYTKYVIPSATISLKRELYSRVIGTNRGFLSQKFERDQIHNIIQSLEENNPNPNPCCFENSDSPLCGDWRLLYTNSADVLLLGLLPGIEPGQIYQNINADGTEITNIVEIQPKFAPLSNIFGGQTMARLVVTASGEKISDTDISLKFIKSSYQPQSLLGVDVSLLPPLNVLFPQFDGSPTGTIKNTFVDDEIRICRAMSSIFVLVKAL
eukprot:gene12032-25215_t